MKIISRAFIKNVRLLFLLGLVLLSIFIITFLFQSHKHKPAAYWVWRPSDMNFIGEHNELIFYQGDFLLKGQNGQFIKRGLSPFPLGSKKNIGILIRVYKINNPEALATEINYLRSQWLSVGVFIKTIQLDYDSPSNQLLNYKNFIDKVKKNLTKSELIKLSITGLLSWITDSPNDLTQLSGSVNYIAYQLYDTFEPLPNTESYLSHLNKLKHSYKIGISTSEKFSQIGYPKNEHFQGEIIFLNIAL